MKPPGGSLRRVPLNRSVPLTRGTGLARTGGPDRHASLRAVSAERAAEGRKQRAAKDTGPSPAVRRIVRSRDLGWCVRCGVAVGDGAGSVHHRVRRSHGADNSPQNLILLCGDGVRACHGWVHAHPKLARARGWMLREGDDIAATPVAVAVAPGEFAEYWLLTDGSRTTDRPEGAEAA